MGVSGLSRPDYLPTPPSALSRFFNWLIQHLVSGASKAAPVGFPIEGFFIIPLIRDTRESSQSSSSHTRSACAAACDELLCLTPIPRFRCAMS